MSRSSPRRRRRLRRQARSHAATLKAFEELTTYTFDSAPKPSSAPPLEATLHGRLSASSTAFRRVGAHFLPLTKAALACGASLAAMACALKDWLTILSAADADDAPQRDAQGH